MGFLRYYKKTLKASLEHKGHTARQQDAAINDAVPNQKVAGPGQP